MLATALGSITATGCRITAPQYLCLRVVAVPDGLRWFQPRSHREFNRHLTLTEVLKVNDVFVDLPLVIKSLEMRRKKIDAVIIFEHRNLQSNITSYQIRNESLDDVPFVLVSMRSIFVAMQN